MTKEIYNNAIREHWAIRAEQEAKQKAKGGRLDAGTRSTVTGGKHLVPLERAVAKIFTEHPTLGSTVVVRNGGNHTLPGWYRRAKNWDLVVTYRGVLVAAIEFKSQVGSIGNNHNNRTEEALGNSVDIWRAHEAAMLGPILPWVGFVMILEKSEETTRPKRKGGAIFPIDPAFDGLSYLDRYRLTFQRLLAERKYDGAVVVASEEGQGAFDEPVAALSFATFEAKLKGRLEEISNMEDSVFPQFL